MDNLRFSKAEALRFGRDAVKDNFGFILKVILLMVAIFLPFNFIEPRIKDRLLLSVLTSVVSYYLNISLSLGVLRIALAFCDYRKPELSELFFYLKKPVLIIKYFVVSILTAAVVLAGLILLVVPGIIWAIQFQFAAFFIVDKEEGPIQAMKNSSMITRGSKWNLFLFALLLILVNIAGFLALIIGLAFTLPLTNIASAFVYRELNRDFQPVASA